jgi:hypothetical protein
MSISSPATELMSLNCPSLTLMDAKDSQKDRDGGEMNVRTVFLIPLTYLKVRRN